MLDLQTVDHLLTTTRSVRKRLDLTRPVPLDVVERCIEIGMQAPSGSNTQHWHFIVVTDPEKKKAIADAYRKAFAVYVPMAAQHPNLAPDSPNRDQQMRVSASASWLAERMQDVPVLLIGCLTGRLDQQPLAMQAAGYGSILPSAWSIMLALRARGLGSAWTTLHIMHETDVAKALGIPDDVTQTVLLPIAYYTGDDFKPAKRNPPRESIHFDTWGNHTPR
ncbi:MAG: nitroreductase [Proteobacteria bacterium]|nr:nitroreductase [Pseudomonadota bacterium]